LAAWYAAAQFSAASHCSTERKPYRFSASPCASIASQWTTSAARFSAIRAKAGSTAQAALSGAAAGMAATASVPTLATLAPAATVRKRRRVVVSMGVFIRGVLSTLSAWVIWVRSPFWLGLEPGRKFALPLGLSFL